MAHKSRSVELISDVAPVAEAPACPEWLPESARVAWSELIPLLDADVLQKADQPALALLCSTYSEWRKLSTEVATEGHCYECKTEAGAVMQRPNPKVRFLSDASRRLISCLSEFGLTPAGRAKNQPKKEKSETFTRFPYAARTRI
jgi:P27 family predicted phage terminase small subunit